MKKIRRFSLKESSSVLTAEEMRKISGGSRAFCKGSQCYMELVFDDYSSLYYYGQCGVVTYQGSFTCGCIFPFGALVTETCDD